MSMNLFLHAKRVEGKRNKDKKMVTDKFDLFQTPTNVSYELLKGNVVLNYSKWVKDENLDEDGNHIINLNNWLENHLEDDGWDVKWFVN